MDASLLRPVTLIMGLWKHNVNTEEIYISHLFGTKLHDINIISKH